MKKKLILIFSVLLFMLIGSATVSKTYFFNGKAYIAFNFEDVDVYIANLNVNGINKYNSISEDKKSITLIIDNGEFSVDLYVTNNATEYDEVVNLDCNMDNLTNFVLNPSTDNPKLILAQTVANFHFDFFNNGETQTITCIINNHSEETEINTPSKKKVMYSLDGIKLSKNFDYIYGITYGNLAEIDDEDYELVGWYREPSYETKVTSSTVITNFSDEVLYGKIELAACSYDDGYEWNYEYSGYSNQFLTPCDGVYVLETWGAQGGSGKIKSGSIYPGGYGGYSRGEISLLKNDSLFVTVGNVGESNYQNSSYHAGGYNGGGSSNSTNFAAGGGATHIATISGELSSLTNDNILIVAGGGGGASADLNQGGYCSGGNAGGFTGSKPITGNDKYFTYNGMSFHLGTGGTQTTGYQFGLGETGNQDNYLVASGGGGGYYGGTSGNGTTWTGCAGGGSGYIGSDLLTNKVMYCYDCASSLEESTRTVSNTCKNNVATSYCSKTGSGFAKITLLSAKVSKCKVGREYKFDYTGGEQSFNVSCGGSYKLEVWGAQGGYSNVKSGTKYRGGYGGYSVGQINLEKNSTLYINVGGAGENAFFDNDIHQIGGYNGGGSANYSNSAAGGGATHIATVSGELSTLSNKINDVLIVAGGGGGASADRVHDGRSIGGNGGGYMGTSASINSEYLIYHGVTYVQGVGGTQTTGYQFGLGQSGDIDFENIAGSGGGGGFYGGTSGNGTTWTLAGGGGSGYIGNSLLSYKSMYCYSCASSSEDSIRTISTTCSNSNATSNCSKYGNGYARITYLG